LGPVPPGSLAAEVDAAARLEFEGLMGRATVAVCLVLSFWGCTGNRQAGDASGDCSDAHLNAVANQGYALVSSGDLYRAHLVGHELVTMGQACGQNDVGTSAGIQGEYILAYVAYTRGARSQAVEYTQTGLAALDALKGSGSTSAQSVELYNAMEPRFLALQARLR
jgi:hypothetical protein